MALTGLQILAIDDVDDVLDMHVMLLQIEGAEVAGARNGHEALAMFRSRHFDVVVCDLGLPDISGDVMIRTIIRAARSAINVVVISGGSQHSLARALEAGAAVTFAKPCQWGSVVRYLEGLGRSPAA